MRSLLKYGLMVWSLGFVSAWAASDFAPVVPDLSLPSETEVVEQAAPKKTTQKTVRNTAAPAQGSKAASVSKKQAPRVSARPKAVIEVTTEKIKEDAQGTVQKMNPSLPPIPQPVLTDEPPAPADAPKENTADEKFEPARETGEEQTPTKAVKVVYNPTVDKDPTLSPDDLLLIKKREEERLRAIEAEKRRRMEEERRRLAELERQRQLELERLRDPSKEVRGKIRLNGIIGQEVFIGNKVYSVGSTIYGARIISVQPDAVVFIYKGQKFTKKVQLK